MLSPAYFECIRLVSHAQVTAFIGALMAVFSSRSQKRGEKVQYSFSLRRAADASIHDYQQRADCMYVRGAHRRISPREHNGAVDK